MGVSVAERIGVIGLGRMGAAMAARAAGTGHDVSGWTRSGGDPGAAAEAGYHLSPTLADVAGRSDILILSLFDGTAVESVLDSLACLELSGRLVAETSTVSPDIVRRHGPRIERAGGRLIDAPVAGGPEMVAGGVAALFLGGAAGDIARFRPVAACFSDKVTEVGPLGSGATAKVVNNMVLGGMWEAICEAVAVGAREGLPLETMMSFLEKSPAAAPAYQSRLPVILEETDEVGFPVSGAAKDMAVFAEVARRNDVTTPAMDNVLGRYRALVANGDGARDLAHVVTAAYRDAVTRR